jgi:hypothetical protein
MSYNSCNKKSCIWRRTIQNRLSKANAYPFIECPYYDKDLPGCRAKQILGKKLRDAFNNIKSGVAPVSAPDIEVKGDA